MINIKINNNAFGVKLIRKKIQYYWMRYYLTRWSKNNRGIVIKKKVSCLINDIEAVIGIDDYISMLDQNK
tara:strand:- start:12121 stop:12330 length:210 start_codon:yes stop_codon:yes gene_type:complete